MSVYQFEYRERGGREVGREGEGGREREREKEREREREREREGKVVEEMRTELKECLSSVFHLSMCLTAALADTETRVSL